MAQTAPPTLTAPPTAPSRADPANFATRGDAFLGWFATAWTDLTAALANVYGNAVDAYNNAVAAASSAVSALASAQSASANAAAAAASAAASAWVSGTTYAVGDPRWSPADGRVYRRRTAGAGTTDPSADATNWAPIAPNGLQLATISGTSGTVAANTDTCFTNPAVCSATLAALGVGDSAIVRFDNGLRTNTLDIGARGFKGPNGVVVTGVIAINETQPVALRWWGDYYRSGV